MTITEVAVFGGTGFLGHRICSRLLLEGVNVRVASRRPDTARKPDGATGELLPFKTDIRDQTAVENAIEGADGVVNAVSLYSEGSGDSFQDIHVEGAARVATVSEKCGVARLVHLSGIGADTQASSAYIRSRAEGETAVRAHFRSATIFRPSVMFGRDDAFLSRLVRLVEQMPVLPLVGRGRVKLQPVCVNDIAKAACSVLSGREPPKPLYEFGGPDIFTFRQLLKIVACCCGRNRVFLPVPTIVWDASATVSELLLPRPPLTRDQLALLKRDNIAGANLPGLADLDVKPTPVKEVLAEISGLNNGR